MCYHAGPLGGALGALVSRSVWGSAGGVGLLQVVS
jgi:hypothetical protein